MQRILVFNNRSETLDKLVKSVENMKIEVTVKRPLEDFQSDDYGGIIISGGFLEQDKYKEILNWYKKVLQQTQIPILGICVGLRIMGYCYGSRIRRLEKEEKCNVTISFHKEYPLTPERKEITAYETHLYELITTGKNLENYGSSETCKIQAVKHKNKMQYGVQFHPEIHEENDGLVILESFIKICSQ